jgi:hypothetical protein
MLVGMRRYRYFLAFVATAAFILPSVGAAIWLRRPGNIWWQTSHPIAFVTLVTVLIVGTLVGAVLSRHRLAIIALASSIFITFLFGCWYVSMQSQLMFQWFLPVRAVVVAGRPYPQQRQLLITSVDGGLSVMLTNSRHEEPKPMDDKLLIAKYNNGPVSYPGRRPFDAVWSTASDPEIGMQGQYFIVMPLWFLMLFCLIAPSLYARKFLILRRRKRDGLCLACGYDMRATADKCPECAWTPPPAPIPTK